MSSIYKILDFPIIYNFVQHITQIGTKRLREKVFQQVFQDAPEIVLDVGCGPHIKTPLPKGVVCGVDINPKYIKQYTGGIIDKEVDNIKKFSGKRKRFGFVVSADNLPFENNYFDECRCMGCLHHLCDETAINVVKQMLRCTKKEGKIIIIDNVWPYNAISKPIPWLIRRLDRGKYVRSEEKLLNLLQRSYNGQWKCARYKYTYYGLEGVIITLKKNDNLYG